MSRVSSLDSRASTIETEENEWAEGSVVGATRDSRLSEMSEASTGARASSVEPSQRSSPERRIGQDDPRGEAEGLEKV